MSMQRLRQGLADSLHRGYMAAILAVSGVHYVLLRMCKTSCAKRAALIGDQC